MSEHIPVPSVHKKYRRLTRQEVDAIRLDQRPTREIAKDYAPATHVSIWMAKTGRTWGKKNPDQQSVET